LRIKMVNANVLVLNTVKPNIKKKLIVIGIFNGKRSVRGQLVQYNMIQMFRSFFCL